MEEIRRRARSAEAKQERRHALLTAATELGLAHGVREVTLTAVTSHIGLHPSALRRYFESREELLLELAEHGWGQWCAGLLDTLAEASPRTAREVAQAVAASLERLPLFCDLLTHVVLSLEGAVRLDRARRYKTAATEAYDEMTDALVATEAGLDPDGARTVLTVAMSAAAYLYQLSRPSPTLRQLYEQEPRWAHDALRFREQLAGILQTVVSGAQHTRSTPPGAWPGVDR
ncbi:TetR family transcriptional regulator [Streptomyces olivaceoviridis]|uniref:TetR family transcriptional regulator n=1 Tax=Streptomyces olivaceoviridis TaxID=1921 RepID=UPI0037A25B41